MVVYGIIAILAYLIGSIPSGLIIGKKFYGVDIRQHGSGNLGGTNTFRVLGVKAGLTVTIADILKGTLAAALPIFFGIEPNMYILLAGIFAVLGHTYPIFAGFKGGKAVATSAGVLLCYAPLLFLFTIIGFFVCLYISKYVSLSSMFGGLVAFVYSIILGDLLLIMVVFVLLSFVIYRHRANIKRIIDKTEPKVKWLG